MEKMNSSNTNVSIRPDALPVVMATNLRYEAPRRLSSGYVFSVVVVEDDKDDSGSGSPEE